ncbi:YybH family protein [Amycolatopsis sp. lyj-109]|uniref:YybH family protein n=1 Tax=Amycolatopsis sp. lyj-109 TaxID=2789287 RepID=UPI00397959A3
MSEQQIRDLMTARAVAMAARDAETLGSHYAPDVVAFTLAPPLVHRGAEVIDVAGRRAWFETFEGPIEYEIRDLEVTIGGELAYCHALNRMATRPKGAPAGFELWFRSTVCFRREDGQWRITHVHDSTPFHMDGTLRAAVDLKP